MCSMGVFSKKNIVKMDATTIKKHKLNSKNFMKTGKGYMCLQIEVRTFKYILVTYY